MDKHQILKQYFGHKAFREGQEQLIDSLLSGRDALGIMPTGGGKSMCYQVPALMLPGVTLVVSPLISLMKDQVMALKHAGIPAAYINSSLTPAQLSTVYQRLRAGAYKLVYVAPERLEADGFVSAAQSLDISLLAVDEAHCISQWGQDFRPSYRKIPDFLTKLPRRPVIGAFTATATEAVRRDISAQLGLQMPCTVVTPSAASPATASAAPPRRSVATTSVPCSRSVPHTTATRPSVRMSAPMRASSGTCRYRL